MSGSGSYNQADMDKYQALLAQMQGLVPADVSKLNNRSAYVADQLNTADGQPADTRESRAAAGAWNNTPDGQAYSQAWNNFLTTPAGQQYSQTQQAASALEQKMEDDAYTDHGVTGALGHVADFWDQYGTPIVASLMTAGIGSAVAGAAGAGGLGGAMGATNPVAVGAINGAAGGAAAGGAINAVTGQSVGQGLLKGGLSGGIGGGLSAYNPAAQFGVTDPTAAGAINGAVKGGVGAAVSGGDIGQGLLGGGLKGGLNTVSLGGLLSSGDGTGTLTADGQTQVDQSGPSVIDKLPDTQVNLPSLAGFVPGGDTASTPMDNNFDWSGLLDGSSGSGLPALDTTDWSKLLNSIQNAPADANYMPAMTVYTPPDGSSSGGASSGGSSSVGSILSSLNSLLGGSSNTNALAGLAGLVAGGLSGGKNLVSTQQSQIDPRNAPYIYGSGTGDPNGFLGAAQQLYQANKSGLNPTMQQGLAMQKAALTDPGYAQSFTQMRNIGNGLLGGQIAGNPFASGAATLPAMGASPSPAGVPALPTMQAGGTGGLLGNTSADRIKALMTAGRGLIG